MKTTIVIQPRKVCIVLLIVAFVMSALAVTGTLVERAFDTSGEEEGNAIVWAFARQFNFSQEANLANFYQGLQLVLASVLLGVIWRGKVQRAEPFRWHWLAMSLIFLFLGADEVAQIHETTVATTVVSLRGSETDKAGWFWVYLPLLAVFGLAYIPFLRHLPRRIAALFVISGSIYVSGVAVIEKLVNRFELKYGDTSVAYVLMDNLSEFMESTGIALFICALLLHLATNAEEIRLRITQTPGAERTPD